MELALSGGEALIKKLDEIARKVATGQVLRVGFLEGDTYPDGTPFAMVAATNEFGGTIEVPEHTTEVYFKHNEKTGEVGNKFVSPGKSNFAQTAVVPAHTVNIPPRPFFRQAVATNSEAWGDTLAKAMEATDYDVEAAFGLTGEKMRSDVMDSIRNFTDPPNAASTIAKKGFDKPLIESSHMLNSVDAEVSNS